MKLIVGLGNPGAKYAGNRHNIGFMALDRIAQDHGFAGWKTKHNGLTVEGRFGADRVVLLKPETFMNNSGQSVQSAMRFHKLEPADVIVLHDEIDLAPGKVKCKTGGGHAGHNGLRSIHAHIGPDYDRVRLGVGHPGHKDAVPGYVLRDFAKAEQAWLDDVLRGISDGAADLARGDTAKFMNAVALRVAPPRSGTGTKKPAGTAANAQAAAPKPAQPAPTQPKAEPAPPDRRPQRHAKTAGPVQMTLQAAFEEQAGHCIALGSPFMGQLMGVLARDWPADTALGRKFAAIEGDIGPSGASLPLRIAGGLHALVLKRKAPALMAVYPPHKASDQALSEAVRDAITTHEAFLLDWTDSAPQTNEVRRSAALIAGARVAAQHFNLPIHLSELGASGGLNLMWDHFVVEIEGHRFGSNMSTILLSPDWTGKLPPAINPQVEKRRGVDLNPLDPTRPDHLLRLMSYIWADQPERLTLTRTAASVMTAQVQRGDAIDWLARTLPQSPEGCLHLIQHTVAWQYFPKAAQARGKALIEAAGKRATRNRPLAWLSMEQDGSGLKGAALTLRLWPGDITLPLARVDFHGRWIDWTYTG